MLVSSGDQGCIFIVFSCHYKLTKILDIQENSYCKNLFLPYNFLLTSKETNNTQTILSHCSWRKTHIFAAQLLKKSVSTKSERVYENKSQHQCNKVTQCNWAFECLKNTEVEYNIRAESTGKAWEKIGEKLTHKLS